MLLDTSGAGLCVDRFACRWQASRQHVLQARLVDKVRQRRAEIRRKFPLHGTRLIRASTRCSTNLALSEEHDGVMSWGNTVEIS